jgi:hypothetical protein
MLSKLLIRNWKFVSGGIKTHLRVRRGHKIVFAKTHRRHEGTYRPIPFTRASVHASHKGRMLNPTPVYIPKTMVLVDWCCLTGRGLFKIRYYDLIHTIASDPPVHSECFKHIVVQCANGTTVGYCSISFVQWTWPLVRLKATMSTIPMPRVTIIYEEIFKNTSKMDATKKEVTDIPQLGHWILFDQNCITWTQMICISWGWQTRGIIEVREISTEIWTWWRISFQYCPDNDNARDFRMKSHQSLRIWIACFTKSWWAIQLVLPIGWSLEEIQL